MSGGAELAILISGKNQSSPAFKSAKADVDGLHVSVEKAGPGWGKLTSAMAAGELAASAVELSLKAVGGAISAAVVPAAAFEESISSIGAVSGASAEDMQKLSDLALQLGKDTSFSAKEAANGIEELVKGGLSLEDIFSGGAKAALDLAAAGGIAVAEAAEIASNAVGQFGLKGAELPHVADMIAGAANASSISVNDFKFSLAAAGAVAHTVGFNFDDLAVAIAEMGAAGIKGSDAGTSLKTMLLNLQPSTKAQVAEFERLGLVTIDYQQAMKVLTGELSKTAGGQKLLTKAQKDGIVSAEELHKAAVNANIGFQDIDFPKWASQAGLMGNAFFDATGKVKGMAEVQGILQRATQGMTREQKLASLEILFGSDAIRAAAVLAEQGTEGYNKFAGAMKNVSAESVAAGKLDNLNGALKTLAGSLETAAIEAGLKLTPALKKIATDATTAINDAIPDIKSAAGQIGTILEGLATKVSEALAANKDFLKSPEAFATSQHAVQNMRDLNTEWDKLLAKFSGGKLQAAGGSIAEILGKQLDREIANAANLVDWLNTLGEVASRVGTAVSKAFEAIGRSQLGDFLGAKAAMDEAKLAMTEIPALIDASKERAKERLTAAAPEIAAQARDTWGVLSSTLKETSVGLDQNLGTLASQFNGTFFQISNDGLTAFAELAGGVTAINEGMNVAADQELGTLQDAFGQAWRQIVVDAQVELPQVPTSVQTNLDSANANATTGTDGLIETFLAAFTKTAYAAESEMPKVPAAVEAQSGPAGAAAAGVGDAMVSGMQPSWGSLVADAASAGSGLVSAFASNVTSQMGQARAAVEGMAEQIRALLPHSDADEGPLSDLTAAGMALPTTLAGGITAAGGVAVAAAQGVVSQVAQVVAAGSGVISDAAGLSFQAVRDKYNLTIPPLVSDATMGFQQVRDRFNLVVPPLKDTAGMTFQQVRDNFNLVIPPLQGQANTTLQGLKGASSAVFATVKTAATTTFDAVQKSATETIPKVATELDGVGEQIATATTGVKGFGTELAALNPGPINAMASAWESVADAIHQAVKELKKFNKAGGGGGGGRGNQGGDANIGVPSGGFDNIPMFPNGGIMPGVGSRHQLALVQPGEEIRSIAQQRAGGGTTVTVLNNFRDTTLIHESEVDDFIAASVARGIRGGRLAIR